jgi:hypothetical protein
MQKLLEKARSFYLTDGNTPIIGPFVRKVLSFSSTDFDPLADPHRLRTWASLVDKDVQYPNEIGDWAYDMLAQQMPTFDLARFDTWLGKVKTMGNCLCPPLCMAPLPPVLGVEEIDEVVVEN